MAKTREDLVNRALDDMGVTDAGETPSAEDYQAVDRRVDTVFAHLAAQDIVSLGDYDNIEERLFEPLVAILASRAGKPFGLTRDLAAERQAEDELRIAERPYGKPRLAVDRMFRPRRRYEPHA